MDEKIFIIGFGFIGRYLAPCYEALLGQPGPGNVLAVKASTRGLEELRQQYPYAISVGIPQLYWSGSIPASWCCVRRPPRCRALSGRFWRPTLSGAAGRGESSR